MAVDITIGDQKFRNVASYSVTEDSSPINPADTTGGYGYISFSTTEEANDRLLLGKTLDLEDGIKGTTQGTVTTLTSNDGALSVSADSRLALLKAERQVMPYEGTLGGAFLYYFGIAGITERIVIDENISDIPVKFIGWYGDLWEFINKQLCPAYEVELALVSDNIVVRPVRQNIAVTKRDASVSWTVNNNELARAVEIYCYHPRTVTNQLIYPYGGWNEDLQIYQVDAGEELVVEIPVDVSLTNVSQPIAQDYVARNYTSTSVYSVVGGDGKPFPAQQWLDMGGRLAVEIGEDTRTLIVTIKGPTWEKNAPYRIAAASGSSGNYYSSLRLIGTGIGFTKELITVLTGVPEEKTATLVGVTIDNPFIDTVERAYDAVSKAVKQFGKPQHTINVTSTGVNREGVSGNLRYPTYNEFAEMFEGMTYDQFATAQEGKTYDEFGAELYELVRDDFDNQAFGNVAGARVRLDHSWYRIRTATTTEAQVTYTAESDTMYTDLNEQWVGQTYDDWKAQWSGKTYNEFSLMPLWKE